MSKRIQRKRTKGWRMPENTVYVGRPSVFGNPFSLEHFTPEFALAEFRAWISCKTVNRWPHLTEDRERLLAELPRLRDKDVACWCPLDKPCHADVLLAMVANVNQSQCNRQKPRKAGSVMVFDEVAIYGEKSVRCDAGCGKRVKRKKKFWQTLSPFNKKPSGTVKTEADIYSELQAECAEWKAAPMTCRTCTAEALGL